MRRCPRSVSIPLTLISDQEMKTRIWIEAMKDVGMKVRRVGPATAMVTTPEGFVQRVRFDARGS